MTVANLIVLPAFYKKPFEATLALLPFITVFNIIVGLISLGSGFLIYNALLMKLPETNFK